MTFVFSYLLQPLQSIHVVRQVTAGGMITTMAGIAGVSGYAGEGLMLVQLYRNEESKLEL